MPASAAATTVAAPGLRDAVPDPWGVAGFLAADRSLRATIEACLRPGHVLAGLAVTRTALRRGRSLRAYFTVEVRGEAGSDRRALSAVWTTAAAAPVGDRERAAAAEARSRGLAGPYAQLAAADPASQLRIDVAPLDVAFPRLIPLSDPRHLAGLLGLDVSPAVTSVRYRPAQRHVLRVRWPGDSADHPGDCFLKVYRDGGAAARCTLGRQVAAALAERLGHGAVEPSAAAVADGAVCWPVAPGRTLADILSEGAGERAVAALRGAGALLRVLHEAPATLSAGLAGQTPEHDLATARRVADRAFDTLPDLAERCTALLDVVTGELAQLPAEQPRFSHGDFKCGNLVADDSGRVTLLDLDRCAVAEPAADLGKILADLHWWLPAGAADAAADALLSGYGRTPPIRLRRARAYQVAHLLRIAARRPALHEPHWRARMRALGDRAAQVPLRGAW